MHFVPGSGGMAQSVEHIVHIDGVVGSSPTVTTNEKGSPLRWSFFVGYVRLSSYQPALRCDHIDVGKKSMTASGGKLIDFFRKL